MSKRGGRLHRLMRKELREILRDRRTIFTLVLMPVLVYPMLNLVFQRYLVSSLTLEAPASQSIKLGFDSPVAAEHVWNMLYAGYLEGEGEGETPKAATDSTLESASASTARDPERSRGEQFDIFKKIPHVEPELFLNLDLAVEEGVADLAVRIPDPDRNPFTIELVQRSGSVAGARAMEYVGKALQNRNRAEHRKTQQWLKRRGLSGSEFVVTEQRSVQAKSGSSMLSSLVPLILIMMTVTGAVYPSIDLTAGERERCTLETLLAAPVSRIGLLLAKYTAVVTVAMLTAMVNLCAMTATIYAGGLSKMVFGEQGLTAGAVVAVLILLVLFAAFFSAVLLMITSSARSFKEAQAYLIPLMLVAMGPGLISLLPGVELTMWLAATPLINVVLLARDIFLGQPLGLSALVAIVSTILYTFLAIAIAAKVFGRDAVTQAQSTTPRRAVGTWTAPSPEFAVICLLVLVPLYYFLGGWLARLGGVSMANRLILAAVATGVIFGMVPWLACQWERVPVRLAMRLRRPALLALVPAAILGLSAWPVAHELILVGQRSGIYTLNEAQLAPVQQMLSQWRTTLSPLLLLACLAAAPAVFEELLFRGYLFRAWEERLGAVRTILLTSILFGAFHMISGHQLTPVRLMPSTFLGLILGTIAWRTGSVWPGMLLHFCNNGLLLMMAYYKDDLMASGIGIEDAESLPGWWLIASFGLCTLAFALLWMIPQRPDESPISPPKASLAAD